MRVVLGVAVGIALLLLSGAALLTLLPSESRGYDCGTWVSPEFDEGDRGDVGYLLGRANAADPAEAAGLLREAEDLGSAQTECEDALSSREIWSLVTFAAGLLVPLGVVVIALATRTPTRGLRDDLTGLPPRN